MGTVLRHLTLIVFCVIILFPIAWVLLLSVKSLPDAYQNEIWPTVFDFSHYAYSLQRIPTLATNFWNSVLVTTGTVVLTTIAAILAGYALVHLRTPGKAVILALLVASLFFPTRVTALIAIWDIQRRLGLINVTWGLILPYVALSIAISVFIMRGMFETIPKDLPDAARIDGAGPVRMLLGIMLPLVSNGIVVVIIVNFVAAWGEYLLAVSLMNDQSARTLPVVLASASGGMGAWVWPRIAAVYVMAITPGLVAFSIAQRWYMKGLQEGALKT
ncbi:MAG: carbohydrate ABC transporter permease [Chloroflexia bacterium]|nr:carbohydrate ABC transporter permease [Chloroflexia bacterium]